VSPYIYGLAPTHPALAFSLHLAKDCPYAEDIKRAVNTRLNASKKKGKGRANAVANSADAGSNTVESAGVASSLLSHHSRSTDVWVCDSGASRSMSNNRSAFTTLRPDRRPICLADGKIVYSSGLGSVRFVSTYGYIVSIHDVLFVPSLAVNLFAANRFAEERRATHMEITDYPLRKWVNRHTRASEFTATIRGDGLAYLDWKPTRSTESVNISIAGPALSNVSMAELHARLNHTPTSVIRRLILSKSVAGIPNRVLGGSSDDFCEDCVNGKLTRAPHTKPATRADRPLFRVFSDVHGPVPVQSRKGHRYWVSFIDDYSRFPAVYFITKKSDVFEAFRRYKAWAENVTGRRVGILRDDKGGEYIGNDFDVFLADAGIRREHSIRDTPQQVGVAERMNHSLSEGITTLLSQSGLARVWWEDAAIHWLHGKIRPPSSVTAPLTPFELFYGRKPNVSHMHAFGCLTYVHLQKDQRPALTPHAAQCILIGYLVDYKGWRFWNPQTLKEVISDSAVFRESTFPFRKPGLSGIDRSACLSPPAVSLPLDESSSPPVLILRPPGPVQSPLSAPASAPALSQVPDPNPIPDSPVEPASDQRSRLAVRIQVPQCDPAPPPPPARDAPGPPPVPSSVHHVLPPVPPAVKQLVDHFEHHPALDVPLPSKRASKGRLPGALTEANSATVPDDVLIPLLDAIDCVFLTSVTMEPKTLADALRRPDADKWVVAALAEIEAHLQNSTWELAQLPPGKRAIGSRWIFKIKCLPDGSIDKYKGRVVAQGFSQVRGVHYNEVFASTARMAAMRTVIAIAATEDLELESVDVSTAFLNGVIDAEIYMKIPEGLEVEGDPQPGEDPKRWVVRLLKGLYSIKQGPRIWALKLHSVLTGIGFNRTDCDHSVYVYRRGDDRIVLPIHVDDLLLASNSKAAIRRVKAELSSHFKLHDQGPATSILGMKIERDRVARTISLSQPRYTKSILEAFGMSDCNPALTPMEDNLKLSVKMSPSSPEDIAIMKPFPYRELIGKLLYLAIATRPDIAYAVGVLCRFVENPGLEHWHAAKRVLRYLQGTIHMKLSYSRLPTPDLFVTYSDADLSGNPDNSRSTGGFAVCIGGGAVQWGSRLQPHVSLSSTESEYTMASKVSCEVMWMRYLFQELGYDVSRPSQLLVDNKSAIQVAKHPEHQSTMKHIHRAYHFIRDLVEQKEIVVSHVPGDENLADIFMKPLGRLKFLKFRSMLGLRG
jgi:hypothetical protein